MNTSPPSKWFPREVQAPRTKLIKWKINDCLRLIGKGVLLSFYSARLSEMMSCHGKYEGILWLLEIFLFVVFDILWERIGRMSKDISSE